MAVMKLVFLLLAVAVHDIKCTSATAQSHFDDPVPTLTCTEDGLQVSVVFGIFDETALFQDATLTLGADDSVTACQTAGLTLDGAAGTTADLDLSGTTVGYTAGSSGSARCSGTLTQDATTLGYTNTFLVDVTETKSQVVRVYRYQFSLTCTLTRVQTEAGTPGFTVSSTLVSEVPSVPKTGAFDLDVALQFVDQSGAKILADFSVNNFEMLSLLVAEIDSNGNYHSNSDYKFTVQRCYASQNSAHDDTTQVDNFLENECPTDDTVTFQTLGGADQHAYVFSLRAFYLSGRASDAVYVHCELFVCRASEGPDVFGGKCVQATTSECDSRGRKRRSVEAEEERKPVFASTKNSFKVAVSGVRCPKGYVFDSSLDECTNQRLLLIKGVYLGLEWNPAYANVSSPAFKQFARVTGAQLEALILNANKENVIKGLKIVAAREGSVILDVLVTYAENVDHLAAFQAFENVVLKTTPQMTRIVNLLNIRQDKVIEYVQVAAKDGNKTNMEMILVVVIVAAVILIAFICGITFYRVQQTRPRHAAPAPATVPNVFENKAMESI